MSRGLSLPAPAQRESREAGLQTTADSPRTKPGGVAGCVCLPMFVGVCAQQGSGLLSSRGQGGNVRPLDPGNACLPPPPELLRGCREPM